MKCYSIQCKILLWSPKSEKPSRYWVYAGETSLDGEETGDGRARLFAFLLRI